MSVMVEVGVVPNSKNFSIVKKDGKIKIHLEKEAENNRANIELIRMLSKLLGCEVRIVSGLRSKHKKLLINTSETQWNLLVNSKSGQKLL